MPDNPPKRRHGDHWNQITPWRAAVIGAYVVAIVLAIVGDHLLSRVDHNADQLAKQAIVDRKQAAENQLQQEQIDRIARNGRRAICIEVNFIENSYYVTREALKNQPRNELTASRTQSLHNLKKLVRDLREAVPGCPPLDSHKP